MREKNCADCLHCKVCSNSTKSERLCYCSMTANKERKNESYWYLRKVCNDFEDMD